MAESNAEDMLLLFSSKAASSRSSTEHAVRGTSLRGPPRSSEAKLPPSSLSSPHESKPSAIMASASILSSGATPAFIGMSSGGSMLTGGSIGHACAEPSGPDSSCTAGSLVAEAARPAAAETSGTTGVAGKGVNGAVGDVAAADESMGLPDRTTASEGWWKSSTKVAAGALTTR